MLRDILIYADNKDHFDTKCVDVTDKDDIGTIIGDLLETAKEHDNCLGLAANQIGHQVNIFVAKIGGVFIPFVNTVITDYKPMLTGGMYSDWEGCLSLPDSKPVKVRRGKEVTVEYLGVDNLEEVDCSKLTLSDLVGKREKFNKRQGSRQIQHEVDHTKGEMI